METVAWVADLEHRFQLLYDEEQALESSLAKLKI